MRQRAPATPMPTRRMFGNPGASLKVFLSVLFFLSGASGLIYEITWVRLFSALFGNSTHAISVVIAVFMAGLAFGSFLLGKLIDREPQPLTLYGVIELGIAASALLVPHLLRWAEPFIAALYGSGAPPLAQLTLVRLSTASLAMLVPTTLMGATFPLMSKYFVRDLAEVGEKVGLLYGLNTLGAVLGCLVTGFYLLRFLGVTNASYLACGINATLGLSVLVVRYARPSGLFALDRRRVKVVTKEEPKSPVAAAPVSRSLVTSVIFGLFVSGFAALSYEVVWSRILGFVLQSGVSTYAFTVMLTTFLGGLGVGGLVYSRWSDRIEDPVGVLGILHVLVGGTTIVSLFFSAPSNARGFVELPGQFWANDFFGAAVLMLAPTILMGILFPLGCKIVTQSTERLGSSIGTAFAINTLGSVSGPLVTGFLLIPLVGSEFVVKLMVTANILTGLFLVVVFGTPRRRHAARAAWVVPVLLLLVVVDVSDTSLVLRLFNPRHEPVVYFKEESSESLLATRLRDGIHLVVGGTIGAGSTPRYQRTDELLAYIPLLLHPAPRDVAVIGFGTGRTSGLFGQHPSVSRVDVIEIARGTLDSGRDVFASFNLNALSNPKVRTIVDDGFNVMKYGPGRYDVVSVDPFTPRQPGSARLYTLDFLTFVKAKLNKHGMVVMWTYPSWVRTTSFRLALKTFHAVFPHATVWTSPGEEFFFFVGTEEPLQFDVAELADRLAARPRQNQYPYHVTNVADFLDLPLLDEAAVQRVVSVEESPLFTVDRPNLEFIYLMDRSRALDEEWRRRMKSSAFPQLRTPRGRIEGAPS